MKKTAGLCPAILIMALSLSGCGGVSMDVDTNTLYVGSNEKHLFGDRKGIKFF